MGRRSRDHPAGTDRDAISQKVADHSSLDSPSINCKRVVAIERTRPGFEVQDFSRDQSALDELDLGKFGRGETLHS
jgi:hypothetical protein